MTLGRAFGYVLFALFIPVYAPLTYLCAWCYGMELTRTTSTQDCWRFLANLP